MTAQRLPENLFGRSRPQRAPAGVDLYSSAEHAPPDPAIPEPTAVPIHPAARLLPMMGGEDFARLRGNIRAHGFDPRKPLVFVPVDSGAEDVAAAVRNSGLVDGRNRLAAALAEGLTLEELPRIDLPAGESPVEYVLRENLDRRQLTPAQRSAAAAAAVPLLAEEARLRRIEGGRRGGRKAGDDPSPALPRDERGRATAQAAARFGAGQTATKIMAAVQKKAPEVAELVRDRACNVAEAQRLAAVEDPAERAAKVAEIRGGADPAKVAPPKERKEPNLGKMIGLLFVRAGAGAKLGPWRDLLSKVVAALGAEESHVQHGGKRLSLEKAVDLLAERLPRPGAP